MSFGEADEKWIEKVTGVDCAYREWGTFQQNLDETIYPSEHFQREFEKTSRNWHMQTEAGRRIFLNLFLNDVVSLDEFDNALRIFPEITMSVETIGPKKLKLNGKTDYTIGFGKGVDLFSKAPPQELHLIALAKTSIGDDDLWQCVAETAALYKSRKDAGKEKCAVWGVLSNATNWIFIHIDENGKLWRTDDYSLKLRSYHAEKVHFIYRALYYIVKCCYECCTPNPTPNSSTAELNE